MSKPIPIFFDYISPFPYFLNEFILKNDIEERYDLAIEWIPVFLGGLHPGNNNMPANATDPRRTRYTAFEARRYAAELGVPYTPTFFKPIPVLRAALAAKRQGLFREFHTPLYRHLQGEGMEPTDALLSDIITRVGGSAERLLEDVNRPDVKQELIANADRAKNEEVFGVPFAVYDGEPYWGYGHFSYLLQRLENAAAP